MSSRPLSLDYKCLQTIRPYLAIDCNGCCMQVTGAMPASRAAFFALFCSLVLVPQAHLQSPGIPGIIYHQNAHRMLCISPCNAPLMQATPHMLMPIAGELLSHAKQIL